MSPTDQIDVMIFQKVGNDVPSEYKAHPSLVLCPAIHAFLGVSPQQVAQQTLIWNLKRPHQLQNLFKILELRTQASMHTQYLLINECADRHDIEYIGKGFPKFDVVLAFAQVRFVGTFIVETVNAVDTGTFVVAPQHEEVLRVLYFVCQHQADRLHRLLSPIYIVSQKEVVCVSRESCVLEQLYQIRILPVDISCVRVKIPHILIGASSSSSIGCSRKISLAFRQSPRTSDQRSLTSLPPFQSNLLMILSISTYSAVFM